MSNKFQGRYQVQDGYAGGSRPQHVSIFSDDLEEDMTDDELVEFYENEIQNHFYERISPGAERVDEFVAWARDQLAKRGANNE